MDLLISGQNELRGKIWSNDGWFASGREIGFELGLFLALLGLNWVKLGLNWLCFLVKSPFSGEKCTKLALFCIKRVDLSNVLYLSRAPFRLIID